MNTYKKILDDSDSDPEPSYVTEPSVDTDSPPQKCRKTGERREYRRVARIDMSGISRCCIDACIEKISVQRFRQFEARYKALNLSGQTTLAVNSCRSSFDVKDGEIVPVLEYEYDGTGVCEAAFRWLFDLSDYKLAKVKRLTDEGYTGMCVPFLTGADTPLEISETPIHTFCRLEKVLHCNSRSALTDAALGPYK